MGAIIDDDFWQVVKQEKLQEGDFEVENSMSFESSHWCRSTPRDEQRLMESSEHQPTHPVKHRSTPSMESVASCETMRIMTHKEFAARHPHPPQPYRVTTEDIDRQQQSATDRHQTLGNDQQESSSVDRHPPFTYRVRLLSIDVARLNALRNPSKPSKTSIDNNIEQSENAPEPMVVERATEGQTLRKRKEKVPKHLKRGATEKKMDDFTKGVFRIPLDNPFDEAYFTHRLWMFFRETNETEKDTERMFHQVKEKMRHRITLKKKSDLGKFVVPCLIGGIDYPSALCDTCSSVSILPKVMAAI